MPRKIRVLQIVTRLVVRGVPRHVLDLATHLDRDRFEVEVLAGRGEPNEGSLWEEAWDRGVVTHKVEALQRAVNPITDLRAYRAIFKRIRKGRYDVVHTHISKAGVIGRLAASRVGGAAIVHTYHGNIEELERKTLVSRAYLKFEQLAADVSDALIAVSGDVMTKTCGMGIGAREQFRVIPNGIDLAEFDPTRDWGRPDGLSGKPIIGMIGSLTPEKGVDVLLEAMPAVVKQIPTVQLSILGDGMLKGELQGQAERLEIAPNVHFAGAVSDVRSWLAAFDLLVLASRREGMGRVLMEAMAMGVPVIGTRVGGIPEVIEDGVNGRLVDSEDSPALSATILELLSDPETCQGQIREGMRSIREFGIERVGGEIGKVYEQLIDRESGESQP